MKNLFSSALTLTLGFSSVTGIFDGAVASASSDNIRMIVTNPGEIACTQMNVGFHAPLSYTNCYVEYTVVGDTSWASAEKSKGSYTVYDADESINPFYNKYAKDDGGNNVLFIYANYLKASVAAQETWAQSVVDKMKGSYKYITLVNHRPATSKYNGKSYSYFWNY